ncbi:MAG: ATP-binding protein [Betaproteobacteria bacterium]|nr:ATP-binding protein [Betaproteobacteria bacterium]
MSSWSDELIIGATGMELRRASEWLDAACRGRAAPREPVERLLLCLNEALTNVMVHGGETALSAPIRLLLEFRFDPGGGEVGVTVSDAGLAFNPLSAPRKALPKTLDEALPGGLGLVMMRGLSDWLDYRHEAGRNHLTFGARWKLP